jgi:hypothetical protein
VNQTNTAKDTSWAISVRLIFIPKPRNGELKRFARA